MTVCVKNREDRLGEVIENQFGDAIVRLSSAGKIVLSELMETQFLRPYIGIDEFVIMPNHVHILLEIHTTPNKKENNKQLKPNSLGVMIGAWKAKSTAAIRMTGEASFAWQDRFYDSVVRDDVAINHIREYIRNNPKNWLTDRNNPLGVYM